MYQNFWTEFVPDDDYIVFTSEEDGKLRRRLCGSTGLASVNIEKQLGATIPMVQQQKSELSWTEIMIIKEKGIVLLIQVT